MFIMNSSFSNLIGKACIIVSVKVEYLLAVLILIQNICICNYDLVDVCIQQLMLTINKLISNALILNYMQNKPFVYYTDDRQTKTYCL